MNQSDPISNQIEGIGNRRLLGCAAKFALAVVLGGVVLGWVARDAHNKALTGAVALALSGLLFGFATTVLTPEMRKLLRTVFVVVPLVAAFAMFASRTLFGWQAQLPLLGVLAPLAFTAGFLIGQFRRKRV